MSKQKLTKEKLQNSKPSGLKLGIDVSAFWHFITGIILFIFEVFINLTPFNFSKNDFKGNRVKRKRRRMRGDDS